MQFSSISATAVCSAARSVIEVTEHAERIVPPPEEQRRLNPADDEHRAVLGEEEERPAQPEYSVWKPATSSDSISGRSNGARLLDASDAMK
jgi:hypothetical protein